MKKIFNIVSFLFFLLLISGCENVSVVNPDSSFKEYIVVRAELIAGNDFSGVQFSKTQPLGQQFNSADAFITSGVTAYLKVGGVKVIPLHHVGNGIYEASDRIRIEYGTQYELYAKVGDNGIYAKTFVPEKPVVITANFNDNSYFQANINAKTNAVYGAMWEIYTGSTVIDSANSYKEIIQNTDNFRTSVPIKTITLPDKYKSGNYQNLWYIKVNAYDPAYLPYYQTRNNNQPISDVFSQGGDQVIWNVKGNNVIGLFMGVAPGDYVKVQ